MRLSRLILVSALLLLAAVPTFAAPPCGYCAEEGGTLCIHEPGGTYCRFLSGSCETRGGACTGFADRALVSEWTVASIEITRPDPATPRLAAVIVTPTTIEGVTAQLARK